MILTTCLRSDDATTRKPFCLQPLSLYACRLKKLRDEERLCSLVLRAMLSITLQIEDFVGLKTFSLWKRLQDCCLHSRRDLQSWTKVLGTVMQYSYFSVILGSLIKQCILFETKLKLGKNSGYTRPTLFVE